MTVFIASEPVGSEQNPLFDLTPAREYGDLVVLLNHSQSSLMTVPTVRKLREKLANFDADKDYILLVGDPTLMGTVAMVAGYYGHGRVKFLKWNKRTRQYIVIEVDISGKAQ